MDEIKIEIQVVFVARTVFFLLAKKIKYQKRKSENILNSDRYELPKSDYLNQLNQTDIRLLVSNMKYYYYNE